MPSKIPVPFTKDQLQKDYEELKSLNDVAQKYGVSKKYVLNSMKAFGLPRRDRNGPVEEVRRLANDWLSATEIAKKLGYSSVGINRIARKNGIEIKDKYHPGYITKKSGYIMVRRSDHPFADSKGYVMLHRIIMETSLGRLLNPSEVVHHKNGNKQDNRIENLVLMKKFDHKRFHSSKKRGPRIKKSTSKKLCAHGDFTQTGGATFPDR